MKISVSLPLEDVEFLDRFARQNGVGSRSSALHQAVRSLRTSGLAANYEAAWEQWSGSDDADAWDTASSDGLSGT